MTTPEETVTPRHEFYETEDRLVLSIFDRGADPEQVKIEFQDRNFSYTNGNKKLSLGPLKGQIDPQASDFTIGKVKVEVRFIKAAVGRWSGLVGDAPDPLSTFTPTPTVTSVKPKKNWENISDNILSSQKELTTEEDPNVGGDAALNSFFQKIFADADEDTKRAMLKSYTESGGTSLSTNWEEVKKKKVDVQPPQGSEWKQWG